ncbi:MAG: EAL domain-containing protein [Acidobacteria bacterium]|nr:MAG: EAL domain-containing protein [Acidobacteriota bacterium]
MNEQGDWYLEGFTDGSQRVWRTAVRSSPFRIGRHPHADLCLPSLDVSQHHAEIRRTADGLQLVDLGSTNGTYLNGRRIDGCGSLAAGDVLRIAGLELRLVQRRNDAPSGLCSTFPLSGEAHRELTAALELSRGFSSLLEERRVRVDFQPVVRLVDGSTYGYEVLGRGLLDGREVPPRELFAVAEPLGRAVELSAAFRACGAADAAALPGEPVLFMNVHPDELNDGRRLLASVAELAGGLPRPLPMAMEIHEAAVTDLEQLIALRDGLAALGSSIAFDDFGTGQARLFELADVGPRYLKFDRAWIRDLDRASRRRELIATLVQLVKSLGIVTIAEGVEQPPEVAICEELGFDLAQGFFFARPAPAASFR